jgi:peptidoglycan/LPS O-acetylase OafA/YrhL
MKQRFLALDGLRGICAILVLLFHDLRFSHPRAFVHGYLSVDVFFIVSGFVLAFAFGEKLGAGMTVYEFMKARIRRLGPVLLFGSLFGAVGAIVRHSHSLPPSFLVAVASAALLNVLLVPLMTNGRLDAFPVNEPSWSLFAELWVNVGFGLVASRLGRLALPAIVVAGWIFLIVHSIENGSADFGSRQATVLYSIPRAIPSFACGVLIFNLWKSEALTKLPRVNPLLLFAGWTFVSVAPCGRWCAVYDVIQIIITAPVLVALLVRYEGPMPAWTTWAGKISYPLYATHIPIIGTSQVLLLKDGHMPLWAEMAFPLISLAVADAVSRRYEPILMKFRRQSSTPPLVKTARV